MGLKYRSYGKPMVYKLKYHPDVKKTDLPKIDGKNRKMIKRAIEERLSTRPEFYAKPLQRSLKGYWKLRVGDYRVGFKFANKTILILAIIHRKEVYTLINKRRES
jgi:mRNA interferase RelE/StbE